MTILIDGTPRYGKIHCKIVNGAIYLREDSGELTKLDIDIKLQDVVSIK